MRFVRFVAEGRKPAWGIAEDGSIVEIDTQPYADWAKTQRRHTIEGVRFLAPAEPSKVVCVGLNYADHAAETGQALPDEPCLFLKPSTALIGPGDDIIYPPQARRVDYEAELAIVIGRKAHNVPKSSWPDFVLGYTCFNDVTARDLQARDGQWTRAKGFDTFAPVGPAVETDLDVSDLRVQARVNGEVRQDSRTSNLIFGPSFLVPFISSVMTLLPGDIIATGTPAGISGVSVGDVVEVEIEGIGVLVNTVAAPGRG